MTTMAILEFKFQFVSINSRDTEIRPYPIDDSNDSSLKQSSVIDTFYLKKMLTTKTIFFEVQYRFYAIQIDKIAISRRISDKIWLFDKLNI